MKLKPLKEACGVFGIKGEERDIPHAIFYGLMALQHRGQESFGVAVAAASKKINLERSMGLVGGKLSPKSLSKLKGDAGIGHVRYSTVSTSTIENAQPILVEGIRNGLAMGYNGNFVNYLDLRKAVSAENTSFTSICDAEIFLNLMKNKMKNMDLFDALQETATLVEGSYAATLITGEGEVLAFRDPIGNRPLCFGMIGNSYVSASESVAIDVCCGKLMGDVEPGEAIMISKSGVERHRFAPCKRKAHCMFEYVYFSRPDSVIEGVSVYEARLRLGESLAKACTHDVDVVIPVPDTSRPAAEGFSRFSGAPVAEGLIKNRYIQRTFIMPGQTSRENAVKVKLNPLKAVLQDKRIIMIDDSIVRGTTIGKLVNMVKRAGAREVHVAITCPPVIAPCFYGIDISTHRELIATQQPVEGICKTIGADSLLYQTTDGLVESIGLPREELCMACITGEYPTPKAQQLSDQMKLNHIEDRRYIEVEMNR
jgi:amidophosphoribosyltransferase